MQDEPMQDTVKKIIEEAQKPVTTYPIPAGELPKKGYLLNIGGLVFEVQFVDYKREEVRMKRIRNYKLMGNGTPIKVPNRILRMR